MKTRSKTLEPGSPALAALHAKLDALARSNGEYLPLIADTITYVYKRAEGLI